MKKRIFSFLMAACMVVSNLPIPAHAEETTYYCGKETHAHGDSCYSTVLHCEAAEHQHGETCYEGQQTLTCTLPEAHDHGEGCKDAGGNVTCGKTLAHVHSEACPMEAEVYTCGYAEAHTHGDGCYTVSQNLICEIPEHTHNVVQCYTAETVEITCGLEVHTHEEACLVDPDAVDPASEEEPQAETKSCTCETACAAGAMNGACAVCSAEGATVEECDQYVAPTGDNPTEGSDATCTTHDWAAEMKQKDATQHYTQVCKICGTANEESVVAHTIKYDYTTKYTDSQHREYCKNCDYLITEACNYASDCEESCSECRLTTRVFSWEEHTLIYTTYIDGDDDSSNDSHDVRCANCSSLNYATEFCYYAFACSETCVCGRANPDAAAHTVQYVARGNGTHDKFCGVCKISFELDAPCVYGENTEDSYYFVSPATCISGATWYKSCACGQKSTETFVAGDTAPGNHTGTNDKLVPNGVLHHNVVWSCCGAVVTENVDCIASNADGSCSTAETCVCGNLLIGAKDNHKLTYTASGNVITETCGWAGCEHTATATLHAPKNPVYDGTQKLASVTHSEDWAGYSIDAISYSGTANDGSSYAGILRPAVKAGTVTASITAQSEDYTVATASVDYTIEKATPVVGTVSVAGSEAIYPHTAITLARTDTSVPGTLALDAGQTLMVGTQEYNWTFTPDEPHNYNAVTGKVSITVVEDTVQGIKITTEPAKTEYTYGDSFDKTGMVVTATYASGATVDVTDQVTIESGILTPTTMSVSVSYGGFTVAQSVTVNPMVIGKTNMALTTLYWEYTGEPVTVYFTVWGYKFEEIPASEYTVTYSNNTEIGQATVTFSDNPGGNYKVNASLTFNIVEAELKDVSVSQNGTLTYTGEAQTPTVNANATTVDGAAVTFTYCLTEDGTYTAELPTFTNAGTYTVYFKANAERHEETSGSFEIVVGKATNEWTTEPSIKGWTYGEFGNDPTATPKFGSVGLSSFSYRVKGEFAWTNNPPSDAGIYELRTRVQASDNWELLETTIEFEIKKATPTVDTFDFTTPANLDVCDGLAKEASVTVKDGIKGVGSMTITYFKDGKALESAPTTAGTYTVEITVAEGANYKPVTLTSDAWTFTFDVTNAADHTNVTLVPNNDGTHDKVCTVCEKVIESNTPCSGTTTDDCDKGYKCACGNYFGTKEHDFSGDYLTDAEFHWHVCFDCGATDTKVKHSATEDGDCTTEEKCACGTVVIEAKNEHGFDNSCDTTCGNPGCTHTREITHTPRDDDGDCTTAIHCSVCDALLTAGNPSHEFDNSCDTDCNRTGCNHIRTITHTPNADDGDCTTAILCSICNAVTTEAKNEHGFDNSCDTTCGNPGCTHTREITHTPREDDGDCTTAIHCSVCDALLTIGNPSHDLDNACDTDCNRTGCNYTRTTTHVPNGDDGNCETAIHCSICNVVVTPAKSHSFTNDCDTDCNNDGCTHTRTTEHKPEEDDGDCTTDILCSICDVVTTKGNASHTGGTASCTAKTKCEVCDTEYGEMLDHTFTVPQNDDTNHWNKCKDCDAIDTKIKHSGEDDGDCTTAVTCTCGYQILGAENHNFVYEKTADNVITETCGTTGCTVHTATATISAPVSPVYNGGEHAATVTYSNGWAGGDLNIAYSPDPVNAGEVTASITKGSVTASVKYTIGKDTPDVGTVSVAESGTIYSTANLTDIKLKSSETLPDGMLALDAGQTLTVGTKDYNWTFKPTDTANYNEVKGTISMTVTEDVLQKIEITTPPTTTEYTYGEVFSKAGMEVTAIYASGKPIDVTNQVTIEPNVLTVATTALTITYDGKTTTQTIKVNPKSLTAEVTVTPDSYHCTGSEIIPTTVQVKDGDTVIPASEYTVEYSSNINAGTATVTILDVTGGNYIVNGSGSFTIKDHHWSTAWRNDASYHWHECGEQNCPITQNSGKDGYGVHTDSGNGLCSSCGYILAIERLQTKTVISEVAAVANTEFDTASKVVAELTRVLTSGTGYSAANVATYDVTLQYSTDGGKTWITATEENFPAEGITVVLPYPAGTARHSHDFKVTHMFTVTSAKLGTVAGQTEQPAVTKLDSGIQVTLSGLSPVGISWKQIPSSAPHVSYDPDSPRTGDITQTGLWLGLALAGCLGLTATVLAKKHYKKRR